MQLDVVAQIARHDPDYQRNKILPGIVMLFASRRPLLEARGSYVIRRLCQLLDPQTIYITLAEILLPMEDLEFITLTIEILNILLLTATELVRCALHDIFPVFTRMIMFALLGGLCVCCSGWFA